MNTGKRNSGTGTKRISKPTNKQAPNKKNDPKEEKGRLSQISQKELQDQKWEEEVNKKKLKEQLEEKKYRNLAVRLSKEENMVCLSIDGSQTSKDAFEIILTEFLPYLHNSVLVCPHIYNNPLDEKFNWRYQNRLTTSLPDYQGYLIIQDRDNKKVHEIEQVYKISEMNECKYFFCGYEGLREQSLQPARIDVGVEYLLGESKIPTFIMKDNKKRGNKNKGYQWLLVMDRNVMDSYRVIDLFLPLIDTSVDRIYGLTLMSEYTTNDEDMKRRFYEKMNELNLKEKEQFDYCALQYKEHQSTVLVDFVNHNTEQFFDFVVFLNNPMKFKAQKQDCETFKFVKLLFANIAFCNYAYIYGYDCKDISKRPNEIDPRKYLDNIKKANANTQVQEAIDNENP